MALRAALSAARNLLGVDYLGREEGPALDVVEATPDGAARPVSGSCFAVDPLRAPEVALVQQLICDDPRSALPGPGRCRAEGLDHHLLVASKAGRQPAMSAHSY